MVDPSDSSKLMMFVTGVAAPLQLGDASLGLFTANVSAPTVWTEYGQTLTKTGTGWEELGVRMGSVIYDSGTFYLFYTGYTADYVGSIGLATSTDGKNWTRYSGNPILTPTGQGRNDGTFVSEPAVLKEGSSWTMLYSYRNGSTIMPGFRCATASDPTSWIKFGSGDVITGAPLFCEFHQILKRDDGLYWLIYDKGNDTTNWCVFAATSKVVTGPYVNVSERPILTGSGVAGTFDRYHVATACLFEVSGVDYLCYTGASDHEQPYTTNAWPMGIAVYTKRDCWAKGAAKLFR